MTKIIFNKSHKIIAAVMALVLCFSAFLWIAPQVQAEELDINDTSVTGFTTPGTPPTITNGNLTGGSIGVYVMSTTGDRYRADNLKWTYNNGEWELDGDSKVLFENNGEKQQIAAYYPYIETTNGKVAVTLPEAYDANYDQYDYLYGVAAPLSRNPATVKMNHLMAKVTVTVASMGNEVAGDDAVESIALADVPRTAEWTLPGATLSEYGDGELIALYGNGSSYTGYALPNGAEDLTLRITMESGRIFTATVSLDDLTTADKIESLEGGVHYRFGLKVGKDAVTLSSVTVSGWADGGTIDGGVATEVAKLNVVDATAMTADELNVAVATALAAGYTDIEVTLAANSGQEMFSAIWTAFSESTAADGSINMTISGAKTVPEYGFFDYDDYSDNDDKNIAGDKLKSLTLTDVETIGEYAFSACTYLESVNLPQVVTIGECAFNEWKKGTKLTSLNLPNATTIGDWAFAYSSLLTSVNLPKVTSIGMLAFGYCDLRTLNLPEVTTIDGEAFLNNYNLVSCSAPKATTIDYYPWGNCSRLETLELTAAGGFTLGNNLFANTPTGQINLMLNKDKESQVTQNADGTATWATTNQYGGSLTYTFKSITFIGE